MKAITVNRCGISEGIMLDEFERIPCGEEFIRPHIARPTFHDCGVVYYPHIDQEGGAWTWDSDLDLVIETDNVLIVKINTRGDGKRESWIQGDSLILKNCPDSNLRPERTWVVGIAMLEEGEEIKYKPEWSDQAHPIMWRPDHGGILTHAA